MAPEVLEPTLDLLRQEYVLVQAWKKTAAYIRYHDWYSDTLEIDWTTVNLREFIAEIIVALEHPEEWHNKPLRIVPAPKSQQWSVPSQSSGWTPPKGLDERRLRPLAHVGLRDQVVATALMLCLANRVETKQGDPRKSVQDVEARKRVISYGNRLFCDEVGEELHHRWGSTKLYRSYFQDYQAFVRRPVAVSETVDRTDGRRVFVVESDLSQFYDRVRPDRLVAALRDLKKDDTESAFFDFAEHFLDWRWHPRDGTDVAAYAKRTDLSDFTRVALPQGLVAAGFLANAVLIKLDDRLRGEIGDEVVPGIRLEDACRYVDDLRIVVAAEPNHDVENVATRVQSERQFDLRRVPVQSGLVESSPGGAR